MLKFLLIFLWFFIFSSNFLFADPLPLFFWKRALNVENFGDSLSPLIIEKIIGKKITCINSSISSQKILAIGSILHFAKDGDIIWGSGINGKIDPSCHNFSTLLVFAVRGPLTRDFLLERGIFCPEIYGDPAILLPDLFPQLQPTGEKPFIVIPNLNEIQAYRGLPNVVLPTQEPMKVIKEILKARFVISGSLHGIIVAEAFGIPARLLRLTEAEHLFKYFDYYLGSGRTQCIPAYSLEEALELGGEVPPKYDKAGLLQAFPLNFFNDN